MKKKIIIIIAVHLIVKDGFFILLLFPIHFRRVVVRIASNNVYYKKYHSPIFSKEPAHENTLYSPLCNRTFLHIGL